MKRKGIRIKVFFACLLLWYTATSVFCQEQTKRILFVGNSYTYFWNLPRTVQEMGQSQGKEWTIRQSTAGGSSWEDHWKGKKKLNTRSIIKEGTWDLIILQNHSMSTIEDPEGFKAYGDSLILLAKGTGAEVMLYQTWARKANPLMLTTIKNGYERLAERHQLAVVQVGEVWESVRQLRPELELYDPDGSHPSTIGTYLTGCIFYSMIAAENSENIPKRITAIDENQQPLYLAIMSQADADFLQEVVDSFYSEQKRK